MSFFLGGAETNKEAHVGGRGRGVQPAGNNFSLAWEQSMGENTGATVGKRIGGPVSMPSKAAYASALGEQIAARNEQRNAADQWIVPPQSSAQPQARHRQASFSKLGSVVVDGPNAAKNAAYAADLRAQIDGRATSKAEERRNRLAAEQEDDMRVHRERAQFQENRDREKDRQAQRHREIDSRADALDRYLGSQLGKGDAPAGISRAQDREWQPPQRRGAPPARSGEAFALG